MAEKTGIAWTDHTFNIAWGCLKVSPGCANCYAKALAERFGFDVFGPPATTNRRTFGAKHWNDPIRWNRAAHAAREQRRVFCSSMCDVFEDHPTIDAERPKLWPLIRATPWLDWLILTKRPERIAALLPADWGAGYENVWLGTSVESDAYRERLAHLVKIPARIRFVSAEPLLAPVTLGEFADDIRWVIIGGESGDGHREMPMEAFAALVREAYGAGCAVFVKQDSGARSGQRGRIDDDAWSMKEWPL